LNILSLTPSVLFLLHDNKKNTVHSSTWI